MPIICSFQERAHHTNQSINYVFDAKALWFKIPERHISVAQISFTARWLPDCRAWQFSTRSWVCKSNISKVQVCTHFSIGLSVHLSVHGILQLYGFIIKSTESEPENWEEF